MVDESAGLAVIGLGIAAIWMVQAGWFYQTGQRWFEICWTAAHEKREPKTPKEAIDWKTCDAEVSKAVFDAGFIFAGNPEFASTPQLKAIIGQCPSAWSDLSWTGSSYYLAVKLVEERGGARFVDRFLPASELITPAFSARWPNCDKVRRDNGFPKIVDYGNGYQWASECKHCKDERRAIIALQETKLNKSIENDTNYTVEEAVDDIPLDELYDSDTDENMIDVD